MKKIECFCVALLLLCTTVVCASDFKVNGICYNIISEAGATVEVASGSCSGTIVILQSVNYNGKNYSVTAVGDRAFSNSHALTSIKLPACVTSVGESAFYCCSTLASVEIPAGVTSIGTAVFYECTGLTSVYMLSETPPSLGVDVFKGSSELVIYVPKGSLATYRADSEWSKYNLIEFDATAIENVADDALSLAVIGGGIRLNAADGKMVAVYTVGGALVEKFDSYTGEEMILDKGVYIIRAGGESLKVRL